MHKENISPEQLAWKTRGTKFCELLQRVGLKAWILRSQSLVRIEPRGHCAAPGDKAGKQPSDRQHGSRDLKNTWGIQCGYYSIFLKHIPES